MNEGFRNRFVPNIMQLHMIFKVIDVFVNGVVRLVKKLPAMVRR